MTDLDAVGNTTKAITKGVAIGSAVIAAVALFGSFMTDIGIVQERLVAAGQAGRRCGGQGINIADPLVFIGLLIGGGIPFLFGSLLVKAVSRAANGMVAVVRKEFDVPGVREGTVLPDYSKAVGISTIAAQRELLPVGIIVVLIPIVVGFILKAEALGGFLAGVILSGQLLAVFMSNTGGAWDNAKKLVEEGHYGGKGSDAHKASVVGDTVGDPLKDTAGPGPEPADQGHQPDQPDHRPDRRGEQYAGYSHGDRHVGAAGGCSLGHQPEQAPGAVRARGVGTGMRHQRGALRMGAPLIFNLQRPARLFSTVVATQFP